MLPSRFTLGMLWVTRCEVLGVGVVLVPEFWLRFHEPSAPIPARLHAARTASHFRLHPGFIWILFSPSRRAGKRRMKAGGLAQGPVSLVQPPSALGPGCGLVGAEGQSALAQS